MIRAFLDWVHRITAPPPPPVEVMVGDVWVVMWASPWQLGVRVTDLSDGWVRFKCLEGGGVFEETIRCFREVRKLKSRAS